MDRDQTLFAWTRQYGSLVALVTVAGLLLGIVAVELAPRRAEAWTVVIETGGRIPPLQLGPVATAIFQSPAVYRPAMRSLGVTTTAIRFLRDRVQLRPIPDTTTLIVRGFGPSQSDAQAASGAMAVALVAAFKNSAGVPDFAIVGGAQPAPVTNSVGIWTASALVAAAAFWLSLGGSLVHWRLRRPVLTLERAARIVEPDGIVTAPVSGMARFLPRHRLESGVGAAQASIRELRRQGVGSESVVVPGVSGRVQRRTTRRVVAHLRAVPLPESPPMAMTLMVLGPPSREADVAAAAAVARPRPSRVFLLWIG